jgi:hypothetical protein
MTLAAFLAACVWPTLLVLTILVKAVRDPALSRWLGLINALFILLCGVMMIVYGQSSIVAVFDVYFLLVVMGGSLAWQGYRELHGVVPDRKAKLGAYASILLGGIFAFFPTRIFLQDLFQPHLVLQGRVQTVRVPDSGSSRRGSVYGSHVADIAGHTVKLTTPMYEELKLRPIARLKVGRGSNYVYEFEHLAD